jgi:hypothetical protein
MKNLEEQIWNFIDGNLSEAESQKIQYLINSDQEVERMYKNFLSFNVLTYNMDLEEPSMSFTRNVMDDVATIPAPVLLKTKVDNRVIYGIAAFFGIALIAVFVFAIYKSSGEKSSLQFDFSINTDFFENKILLSTFLAADLIIAMLFIDGVVRKRLNQREKLMH